jgi:hypothetical protein
MKHQIVIIDENNCWIWQGFPDKDGYGRVKKEGKQYAVHRYVYWKFKGTIPTGYAIDHLCRVKMCCNPSHLEAVLPAENSRRNKGLKYKKSLPPHKE